MQQVRPPLDSVSQAVQGVGQQAAALRAALSFSIDSGVLYFLLQGARLAGGVVFRGGQALLGPRLATPPFVLACVSSAGGGSPMPSTGRR